MNANSSPKQRSNFFLLTVLILISLVLAFFVVERNNRLIELEEINNINVIKSEETVKNLQDKIKRLETDYDELKTLFDEQEDLLRAVESFQGIIGEVNGELDISYWVDNFTVWIDEAKSNLNNLDKIKEITALINDSTKDLTVVIDDYNKNKTQREQDRFNGVGTIPRQALDSINPAVTMSVVSLPCNSSTAVACVSSTKPNHIQVSENYLHYSYDLWYMIMMHEYAHTIQLNNYDALSVNETFIKLFNKDLELHADCMAASVIGETYFSTYNNTCSKEQLAAALGAWTGKF